jgi:hypothetical protein
MKDMTQRAHQTPVESVAQGKRTEAQNANTLTRISLALTRTFEMDEANRGTDPYNSLGGSGSAQVWNRQRPRR